METIITASITAAVTLIVCLINNYFQSSKQNALLVYRLDQLEKKMDKHNQIVERLYLCEENDKLHDAELKRVNARLGVLEGGRHEQRMVESGRYQSNQNVRTGGSCDNRYGSNAE